MGADSTEGAEYELEAPHLTLDETVLLPNRLPRRTMASIWSTDGELHHLIHALNLDFRLRLSMNFHTHKNDFRWDQASASVKYVKSQLPCIENLLVSKWYLVVCRGGESSLEEWYIEHQVRSIVKFTIAIYPLDPHWVDLQRVSSQQVSIIKNVLLFIWFLNIKVIL